MVAWQQEKARLMAEMSLAGQKGAYGKLGALSSGLNRAFDDHIELSLRAGAGTHVRTEEVQALANGSRKKHPAVCWRGASAPTMCM